MLDPALTASVIICAYTLGRWNELVAAVESVQTQVPRPAQVIVVIDHNPELLAQARSAFGTALVIPNAEPRGLSGARNSGTAVATGEIVAFLDDDAVATPGWLARILSAYADELIAGVGGQIVPRWQAGRPAWFPDEFNWVVGCSYRGMPEREAPVRNLIGANMSLRRALVVEAGGFRSGIGRVGTLPVGCEETELCIRIHQRHPEISFRYLPDAGVAHLVTAGRSRWRYFRSRCYAEGISKALVARLVGAQDGLASERAYTVRTLPAGALRGLANALSGDLGGLGRAGAIIAGLAFTAVGYLRGRVGARVM